MKNLIRKILRESFKNPEIMSSEYNICDIMSVNSWEEIDNFLNKMDYDEQYKEEIEELKHDWSRESNSLSNKLDINNTYLRKIQNLLCK